MGFETGLGEAPLPLLTEAALAEIPRIVTVGGVDGRSLGRLSRVATTLLLLRAGYGWVPYSSLERVVEEIKDNYYLTLRRAQATLDHDEKDLGQWVTFFVRCLVQQKDALAAKLELERRLTRLPVLDEELLRLVRERGNLTISEAVAATGKNRNTVKTHLRAFVEMGRLALRGRGRGVV